MSKLYLRNTTANVAGYGTTEQSVALPNGTNQVASLTNRDLGAAPGSSQITSAFNNGSATTHFDTCNTRWISAQLAVSSVSADTWTFGYAALESSTNLNAQLGLSVYVLTSSGTVRGFVRDSHTLLGIEFAVAETGQVVTFAGSAVAGVASTDRLVVEVWCHMLSSMASIYSANIYYDGTTDPVNAVATSNAASYISTPQDLFLAAASAAPRPVVAPSLAVQRASRW